jgi:Leucine-rich repeat (LRR) protein
MEDLMAPEIPLRSQFTTISETLIANLSCQLDLTKITYLNLFNNCIRKIEALDKLVNLEILILSFNQI